MAKTINIKDLKEIRKHIRGGIFKMKKLIEKIREFRRVRKLNNMYKGLTWKEHVPLTEVQENWLLATATEEELKAVEEIEAMIMTGLEGKNTEGLEDFKLRQFQTDYKGGGKNEKN
ncbi:hypothetical protein [Neobacillus cucumis]|uniref:hypothetical protein n=1 Tax=Neobacillus cucumis TaxID=1740721 RepID=UPI0028530F99|nr:hypothetical protein [Neobacillus cucumis]MDR4948107.1 hypothetical protein [Neobacillus cucumis]